MLSSRPPKKILFSLLFLALLGGVFLWWQQRGISTDQSLRDMIGEKMSSDTTAPDDDGEETDEDTTEETLEPDDPLNQPDTTAQTKKSSAYVVDAQVCDNECAQYTNNQEALSYCQAVCGLAPAEGAARKAPENCETLTETAKDICYRDQAVEKKDASLCEKIIDRGLRQACQNRMAEEYFD